MQKLRQGLASEFGRLTVTAIEIVVECFFVEVGDGGSCNGHDISIDQSGTLKQSLNFLPCCDMALVSTVLDPDAPLIVHIGFAQAIRHGGDYHHPLFGLYVLGDRVNGWAHMLRGSIGKQLIQTSHIGCIQTGYAALIPHPQQQ